MFYNDSEYTIIGVDDTIGFAEMTLLGSVDQPSY